MKKSILCIFLLYSLNIFAQIPNTWQNLYGTTGYDFGVNSVQIADSSIMLCNNSTLDANGYNQLLLINIDTNGNEIWRQNYSINNMATQASDIIISSDNKLIISGTCNTLNSAYDFFIMKLNLDGSIIWTKTYGGIDWDICNEICETEDNKLIACGYTYSYGNGNSDIYLLQTDLNGDSLNSATYGNAKENQANAICTLSDSGFIVAGFFERDTINIKDAILLKYDKNFNLVWANTYGDSINYVVNSLYCDSVTNKTVFACTRDISGVLKDPRLLCINQDYKPDSIIWTVNFLFSTEMLDVIYNYDEKTFLSVGYGGSSQDIMYYKFNLNGVYILSGNAGTYNGPEKGYSISECFTGGYIICGSTKSYNYAKDEIFIIKTDNDLRSDSYNSIVENKHNIKLSIYPNPCSDFLYINYSDNLLQNSELQIFNNNGQLVYTNKLTSETSHINLSKFENGIYYINIYKSGIKINKIIIISK